MKILYHSLKAVLLYILLLLPFNTFSQEKVTDSTTTEQLDEVLIKAIRVKKAAPITHTNFSKKEIAKKNLGQDIPILLNTLPSVVSTSDAGAGIGYTYMRIRGVNAQSTNITLNGIPFNDAESLGTFWVNLSDFASSIESLQVQRGVGTSTNGTGAFGASINILTDAVSEKPNGTFSNSFGSFNTRKHSLKFSTGKLNNRFEIAGRLSQIQSNGYIDRAAAKLKSYFLQGAYVDENRQIKAITFSGKEITYQAWYGLEDPYLLKHNPTFNVAGMYTDESGNIRFHKNEVDNYQQDHYQLHYNERFNNNWSANLSLNYTKGKGYFEQYKEDQDFSNYGIEPVNINNTAIYTTDLIRRRWLDNDFYVANASANYKKNTTEIISGTSYSFYNGDHFGEIIWARNAGNSEINQKYYQANGKKNDLSFFTKANVNIHAKVKLFADLQYRNVKYKTKGLTSNSEPLLINKYYHFFNPKLGLTYLFNKNTNLYFSFARANREPSRDDFENNTQVKPEQLNDWELGFRIQHNKFTLNTNVYYMLYNEQLVLTGALDNVGNPIRTNSGKSYRLGLEVETAIQPLPWVKLYTNLTLSTNKNKNTVVSRDGALVALGKTDISYAPEIVAANVLETTPLKNLNISLTSKYVGEQYMGNTNSKKSKLASYFVNDFGVNYLLNTKTFLKKIETKLLINNVLNKKYISNGYYYTYDDTWSNPNAITTIEGAGYYPQATRNFLLGLTLTF